MFRVWVSTITHLLPIRRTDKHMTVIVATYLNEIRKITDFRVTSENANKIKCLNLTIWTKKNTCRQRESLSKLRLRSTSIPTPHGSTLVAYRHKSMLH